MNTVYNASAGTGKTYQVTALYEKLVLEDGIDPRDILLMTFTENAAAELRMRVTHRVMKTRRQAEDAGNDDDAERTATALNHLPSSPIGTIHSYCTNLLREHALDTGLPPQFGIIEGDERRELLDRICRDELLRRLGNDPDFNAFCSGTHIIGDGGGFGTSITETVPKLIDEAGSLGLSLDQAEAMLPETEPRVSIDEIRSILQRLEQVGNRTKKINEAIGVIQEAMENADTPRGVIEYFDQHFSGHFSYGDAKLIYPDFKELKEAVLSRELYRERYPAAKAFARYVQAVAEQFQRQKHELNVVDFDDQLRLAMQLLESGKAKPDFRYVIVDEVQDTSRIQCRIIQALWTNETNLVICGDKKQSIYTWRGADPQVMPDLEQLILEAGGGQINLQTSFRSKAPILDVINELFAAVYGPEEYAEDQKLEANPGFETPGEKPCIEFLLPDDEQEELTKQDVVGEEMAAVAHRIKLLVEGPDEFQPTYRHNGAFEKAGPDNAYRYSDILILLRRTTHQSALEHALRHAGIPYTLGGKGRGLFTRQEARDVSLFLNVVTNPNDGYSLIGFLRSPWVGLSDETIAELAWSENGFSIDNLMASYGSETDVVTRFREKLGGRLASELVRMLIDETGYDALLAGLPRGTQRLANLRKVLDWIREAERGARTTPATVARKLAAHIANPPQVPEAALLDPAQNAVTIMTVHGSKGLTKRVVFMPDISSAPKNDTAFSRVCFDEKKEPMLAVKITAADRSSVESPGFKEARTRAKEIRDREFKNLLYVAMTRARDLVITSASGGAKSAGWLKDLEPLLGNSVPTINYAMLADAAAAMPETDTSGGGSMSWPEALALRPPAPTAPELRRQTATGIAEDKAEARDPEDHYAFQSSEKAAAMGTLGHAVLEQLAMNDWQGAVGSLLEKLRGDFDVGKHEALTLKDRLENVRTLMVERTGTARELRPEFPFVMHEQDRLIDGTIDMLCIEPKRICIYDYKFTEADDETLTAQYREQLRIYAAAAKRLYGADIEIQTALIVVTADKTRVLPVVF
jgi:ATP-dependent helicase/nuclease subunit A